MTSAGGWAARGAGVREMVPCTVCCCEFPMLCTVRSCQSSPLSHMPGSRRTDHSYPVPSTFYFSGLLWAPDQAETATAILQHSGHFQPEPSSQKPPSATPQWTPAPRQLMYCTLP